MAIAWGSAQGYDGATLALYRDAANTLAQRNGTNPQTTRIYNTFTDVNNYERLALKWTSNTFQIQPEAAGTGVVRPLQFPANGLASTPPVSLTGTWFTGGTSTTTKPHLLIEPTGTTSTAWSTAGTGFGVNAPSGFTGDLAWFGVGGVRKGVIKSDGSFQFGTLGALSYSNGFIVTTDLSGVAYSGYWGSDKLQVHPSMAIAWGSVQGYDGETLALHRDAAHILAQRIGTNAQTTRIYNTFTSATNFERAKIEWSSNILRIGTEKGSAGGTARDMELQTDAITRLAIDTVGSIQVATALTVATLPAAPVVGMVARVTDATAPVMGATVVGGGAAAALVWYNGANWTVIGV
jgi:hypothetical protein